MTLPSVTAGALGPEAPSEAAHSAAVEAFVAHPGCTDDSSAPERLPDCAACQNEALKAALRAAYAVDFPAPPPLGAGPALSACVKRLLAFARRLEGGAIPPSEQQAMRAKLSDIIVDLDNALGPAGAAGEGNTR